MNGRIGLTATEAYRSDSEALECRERVLTRVKAPRCPTAQLGDALVLRIPQVMPVFSNLQRSTTIDDSNAPTLVTLQCACGKLSCSIWVLHHHQHGPRCLFPDVPRRLREVREPDLEAGVDVAQFLNSRTPSESQT